MVKSPSWFQRSIEYPCLDKLIEVNNCPINYRYWGDKQKDLPELIFIHGNGAHLHWWDFIAPAFAPEFNIAALDLSGAGDSGHRQTYTSELFAKEVMAVASDAKMSSPILVGHSFGGTIARITTWLHQDQLKGLVIVDSTLTNRIGRRISPRQPRGNIRFYNSPEEAMLRFRLRPTQPCENKYLLDHIARHSIKQTENGWCFKSDQALFSKMQFSKMQFSKIQAGADTTNQKTLQQKTAKQKEPEEEQEFPDSLSMVKSIEKPVALIYGDKSRFFDLETVRLAKSVIQPELLCQITDAHHHLFLDQPLSFIDTLRSVLGQIQ